MRSKSHLRAGYLSGLENAAQSLGTMAPSVTIGIWIPIVLGQSGHATCLLMFVVLGLFLGIAAATDVFASRCSSAGSLGAFAAIGLGSRAGVVASWFYILAMTCVVLSAAICGQFCADLLFEQWIGPSAHPWRPLFTLTSIVVGAWVCAHRDVRLSTKIMLAAEFTSVFLLGGITLIALAKGSWWDVRQFDFRSIPWSGIRLAIITTATTWAGFESATTLGEEVTEAKRTIPRTMLLCLVPAGVLYLLATYSLGLLEDRYQIRLGEAAMPFDMLAHSIGIPILGTVSLMGITASAFAAVLAGINAGSRVLYDLARQQMLPAGLALVHRERATPTRAIALLALIGIVIPAVLYFAGVSVTDAINYTIQVASYGYLGSYFLVCVAAFVFVLRQRPARSWVAGVTLAAFLAVGAILIMSVVPLPEAPWGYVAFVSFAVPLAGAAWSELCRIRHATS